MFQEKKIELKENLIVELEEKKKNIENERHSMDLTGGRVTCFLLLILEINKILSICREKLFGFPADTQ